MLNYIPDKDVVEAALQRSITVHGVLVTNIDFAWHLFYCARELLPFNDSLRVYGYERTDFSEEVVKIFEHVYGIGNAHIKRELTARLISEPREREANHELLDRVFGLYPKAGIDGNGPVQFNIIVTPTELPENYGTEEFHIKKDE